MAKRKNGSDESPVDPNARLETTPEDRTKATKWFSRARDLGEKRQFDYAVEYYVNGLEFWPDAVEEACKALHGCAVARKQTGGKRPGLKDTMRRSTNDKDPRQAFLNSLWLFGHDPDNLGYLEAVVNNACRLRAEDAAKWAAGVFTRALDAASKVSSKQFQSLAQQLEELGDRAATRDEGTFAVDAYRMGVDALNVWRRKLPKDGAADVAVKNLSTKLTIQKGKYQEGESYRDSVVDSDEQRDLHDQQRTVQSDERLQELIAKAEADFQQDIESAEKLKNLVDLLCRREREEEETRAIGILVEHYKRTGAYRWKQLADDIRMKQLARETRESAKAGDADRLKEQRIARLRFELSVFKERIDRYPTDHRMKYEYGVRNFQAGRFDEAIPLFQAARSDPKNRAACGLYLGRCFFRKGYHAQAVSALEESLREYEFQDDDTAKSMLYWLGRAYEEAGQPDRARDTYGRILQVDYNYGDVRDRMDKLPEKGAS